MEQDFRVSLTFDDVLLRPGFSDFGRDEIDLGAQLTRKIRLETPVVAAPMDTVCESGLAIALAREGGIGFIHRNLTADGQADEVRLVKKEGLPVGAAVGSSAGYETRVETLVDAGVDVLLVDSAHGHSKKVIGALEWIKKNTDVEVVAGNVSTTEGARALVDAGADGLRVGMGPGAICTTRIVSGMGVPQLSALMETTAVGRAHGVPVIADGGIRYSGDITKALAIGASTVMLGRLLASTREAPGKTVQLGPEEVPDRFKSILDGSHEYCFKEYRGMGSVAAMQRGIKISSEDEFHGKNYTGDVLVAEGVEGLVPCNGTVHDAVTLLMGGVTSGFYYIGARSVAEAWKIAQFHRITQASLSESHPHDLFVTNTGGNY
ncbi:MAG TPA: IMP dehydrogenase [Candidatus Saccharimonas sp.]|nr:IMP dehydrogenase [Candidatus Saccharimonas sp.]